MRNGFLRGSAGQRAAASVAIVAVIRHDPRGIHDLLLAQVAAGERFNAVFTGLSATPAPGNGHVLTTLTTVAAPAAEPGGAR